MSFKETKHGFDFGENAIVITEYPFYNHIMVGNSVRIDDAVMEDSTYVREMPDGKDAIIIGFADFNLTISGKHVRKTVLAGLLQGEKNNTEVFGEGYLAGYNQALVDKGHMTQEEADEVLRSDSSEQSKIGEQDGE